MVNYSTIPCQICEFHIPGIKDDSAVEKKRAEGTLNFMENDIDNKLFHLGSI